MKSIKLLGTAIAALALMMTACKKSSSGNAVGTGSMTVNGQSTSFTAVFDTSYEFNVIANGVLPASKDTVMMKFYFSPMANPAPWFYQFSGLWSDTSNTQVLAVTLVDSKTGYTYYNVSSLQNPAVLTITSNKGNTLSADFSGVVYYSQTDSLLLKNGSFTAKLQ